jgi:hypothetical protein
MQCSAIKTVVCLTTIIFFLHSQSAKANEWKLEKQDKNVSLYSQDSESGYKEIKVKTRVKAHPHALVALLNDVEYSPNWMHNCIEVKIIDEMSPTERVINSFFAAPWPVKDRDMVILSKSNMSPNAVRIEISDQADHIKHHTKYVRMQKMYGVWQATLTADGMTDISYTGGGNPGGNLPVFIADRELISSMFKTFQNLQQAMQMDKYQPAEITD